MTGGVSPAWPGSDVLAGWSAELASLSPRALWIYHLPLRRVEALVGCVRSDPLDHLHRFLLRLLADPPAGLPLTLAELAQRLHLDPQILYPVLVELELLGLVRQEASPATWVPTDAGRQLGAGSALPSVSERRVFYFVEGPATAPGCRFVAFSGHPSASVLTEAETALDPQPLHEALQQSADWKQRHRFPAEVRQILRPNWTHSGAWRQVTFVRRERVTLLLALLGSGEDESLLGLALDPVSWRLHRERPVLELGKHWRETFPELLEAELPAWRDAWQTLIPTEPIEAEDLTWQPLTLQVRAPLAVLEHWDTDRETWLLAGNERIRQLARVEVISRVPAE